jgi:membrane-bound serine protease (ClpP class)
LGALCFWFSQTQAESTRARIELLPYDGAITPIAAEYLVDGIHHAERSGASAVVIQLDTPGGLDTSMRQIVKTELAAEIPVVVYVAPSGSRAASAGVFITMAANVAAMAPGTNIGSASPVNLGGGGMDSTMTKKVTHDAVAYLVSIAAQRGRNEELAKRFVETADNLPAKDALQENVIDYLASSLDELLEKMDGKVVSINGVDHTLHTSGAEVEERPMNGRQRFLKALVDPSVAYILMLLGIYGLFFELSNPGSLAPGILGGICLLLALFAFQNLPINNAGIALLLLGMVLLILEVKVTSYGALTIGGLAAMVLGSLMLFDSEQAWARVSLKVMIPALAVFAGFFMLCVALVVRTHRRPAVQSIESLVGERGRVVDAIPGGSAPGKVVFHGEIWDAISELAIPEKSQVEVMGIEGRVARVKQVDGA